MKSLMSLIIPAFAAIYLAACELDITSNINVSDLRAVATGYSEGETTIALVAIQIPVIDKCDNYANKLTNIMTGILTEFSPNQCRREGLKSYLFSKSGTIFNQQAILKSLYVLHHLCIASYDFLTVVPAAFHFPNCCDTLRSYKLRFPLSTSIHCRCCLISDNYNINLFRLSTICPHYMSFRHPIIRTDYARDPLSDGLLGSVAFSSGMPVYQPPVA